MVQHVADTRTRVERNHAIVAPDSHVRSQILGWKDVQGITLISPAMATGAVHLDLFSILSSRWTRWAVAEGAFQGLRGFFMS